MSDDMKSILINTLLMSVVFIGIISFGIGIGANYEKNETFMKTKYIDITGLQGNLTKTQQEADEWADLFQEDNPFIVITGFILKSIWTITIGIWSNIIVLVKTFFGLFAILGIPPLVTGTIMTILILNVLFLAWRLIKLGW